MEKFKFLSLPILTAEDCLEMQAVSVILFLISIGTIVAPVGAVVVIYHNDLTHLVITPQIQDIINGNSSIIPHFGGQDNGNTGDNSGSGQNETSIINGLVNPVFVGAQVDTAARTCTVTVNITNSLNYDLTINSFSAELQVTSAQYPAGNVSLASPVTIPAGQTSQVTISGYWTQDAENYVTTNYPGATAVDAFLANLKIDVNGIVIELNQSVEVGNIPLNGGI